jgi:hypothetical protein
MPNQPTIKAIVFAKSLRRTLYRMQQLQVDIEDLLLSEGTTHAMSVGLKDTAVGIRKFIRDTARPLSTETWDAIYGDITADRLHDLGLLMDVVADAENLEEITEEIKRIKKPLKQ